jgi:hypothetical protein
MRGGGSLLVLATVAGFGVDDLEVGMTVSPPERAMRRRTMWNPTIRWK